MAFSVRLASASISVQAFLGEAAGTDRRILDEIDQNRLRRFCEDRHTP